MEDMKLLSAEELEAISGGSDRNWVNDGCSATCEMGSDCWGGQDYCSMVNTTYDDFGWNKLPCPKGGTHDFGMQTMGAGHGESEVEAIYGTCRKCGFVCDRKTSRIL
jgi:hypothetical protein